MDTRSTPERGYLLFGASACSPDLLTKEWSVWERGYLLFGLRYLECAGPSSRALLVLGVPVLGNPGNLGDSRDR